MLARLCNIIDKFMIVQKINQIDDRSFNVVAADTLIVKYIKLHSLKLTIQWHLHLVLSQLFTEQNPLLS